MTQGAPVPVTCAIIVGDGGRILAAQRPAGGRHALKWELPGGKLEPGEQPEDCIRRELREELGVGVEILARLPASRHDYGTLHVELLPFVVKITSGEPRPHAHSDLRWVDPCRCDGLGWAEADLPVLAEYGRRNAVLSFPRPL